MNDYIKIVIQVVSNIWGVRPERLSGKERFPELVYARRFVYALIKQKHDDITLSALAKTLNKTHATVIFALKQHAADLEYVESYKGKFKSCERKLSGLDNSNKYDAINSLKEAYLQRIDVEKKIDILEGIIKGFDKR